MLNTICPNYNSDYWKELVEKHGEEEARFVFFKENQPTYDSDDVNYSPDSKVEVGKKVKSNVAKRPSIQLGLFRNWFKFVPTTKEQRRAYNIEQYDSAGNPTGEFFTIDVQEAAVEGLFKLSFDNVIAQQKEIAQGKRTDLNVDEAIKKSIESIGRIGLSLYNEKDLSLEEREANKYFHLSPYAETYLAIYFANKQFVEFVKRKYDALDVDVNNLTNALLVDEDSDDARLEADLYKESNERDPKETMSKRVKLFLATMPEYKREGDGKFTTVRNALGLQKLYGYENLYEKLVSKLSSKPKLTFDIILQELRANPDTNPTFYMLGEKIATIDPRIQNEFVTALDKINAEQYVSVVKRDTGETEEDTDYIDDLMDLDFSDETVDGEPISEEVPYYKIYTIKSNQNSYVKKILSIWEEEQKRKAELVRYDDSRGEYVVDSEKVQNITDFLQIINEFENFHSKDWRKLLIADLTPPLKQLMRDILEKTPADVNNKESRKEFIYRSLGNYLLKASGIFLSDEALVDLNSGEYAGSKEYEQYNNKNATAQFAYDKKGKPLGVYSDLLRILQGKSDFDKSELSAKSNLQLSNPLYVSVKEVSFLAELQGKYNDVVTTTHVTADGKKVYDYILPNFQFKEFLKLKNSQEYRDKLSKDIFASNNYLFKALNNEQQRSKYKLGLYEALDNKISNKQITRDKMSDREQIMMDFYNFLNDGDENTANYFDLTKSDKKTTPYHIGVPKLSESEAIFEYFNAFKAEYLRIINSDKITLDENGQPVSKQFETGKSFFFLLPELNYEFLKKLVEVGKVAESDLKALYEVNPDNTISIRKVDDVNSLYEVIDRIITDVTIPALYNNLVNNIAMEQIPIDIDANKLALRQYAFNSHLFNISVTMLYSGDIALFSKGNSKNLTSFINTTYDQYTKRLAKDIAPGIKPNFERPQYRAITIKAQNTFTKEYKDLFVNKYYGLREDGSAPIDPSDAAQFCTVKRYFEILYSLGRVPVGVYNDILARIEKNPDTYRLTDKELSYIQPLKPVEVNRSTVEIDEDKTYNYINYVKSSLIPLVPNFTSEFEIDGLRKLMEDNHIDQANLDTAGKSGNPVKIITPFTIDNKFSPVSKDKIDEASRIMNSDSFLIQQEIPFDMEKEKTTFVTQFNKLVLDTITSFDADVFDISDAMKDSLSLDRAKVNGAGIAEYKEKIRTKIMEESFNELKDDIGIKPDGSIDVAKLRTFIIRNVSDLKPQQLAELDVLKDDFAIPLIFNRAKYQIESSIASSIRKAINNKMFGKSYVQVTSLGISRMDKSGVIPSNITRTKNWDGKELKPTRPVVKEIVEMLGQEIYLNEDQLSKAENGKSFKLTPEQYEQLNPELVNPNTEFTAKIMPAQVIVPFQFFENFIVNSDGKAVKEKRMLRMEDFMIDGVVHLDDDLLKMVAARIPNQSHSSQLPIEIVGFLPPTTGGDVMYVPANITVQMGSDFDIDKVYAYKRKYKAYVGDAYIEEIKALREERKQLIAENSRNLMTNEQLNTIKEVWDNFNSIVVSKNYLDKFKEQLLDKIFNNEIEIDDSITDESIEDFINNLTLANLEKLRSIPFKDIPALYQGYSNRVLARLIKNKDLDYLNAFKEHYVMKQHGDLIEKKKEFIDRANRVKAISNEIAILTEKRNALPRFISSKLNIDEFGNLLPIVNRSKSEVKVKRNTLNIKKVISGLQTGIDTLGLSVAKRNNIITGGVAPKGYFRENKTSGIEDARIYGVREENENDIADYSADNVNVRSNNRYNVRTYSNVRDADITIYFSTDTTSAGFNSTKNFAINKAKKKGITHQTFFVYGQDFETAEDLKRLLVNRKHDVINIAGSHQSKIDESEEGSAFTENVNNILNELFSQNNKEENEEVDVKPSELEYDEDEREVHELDIDDHKNAYFDTLYSILTSPALFNRVMKPLDMNDLKATVAMRSEGQKLNMFLDRTNQLKDYSSNVGVKKLVGTFSLNLTFNVLLQRTKNVKLTGVREPITKASSILEINGVRLDTFSGIGRTTVKYKRGEEEIEENRTNSDNIIIPQSETVDHANNKVADKINVNDITANAYAVLVQLHSKSGKSTDNFRVSQLMNNRVIKHLVSKIRNNQDSFSKFSGGNLDKIVEEVKEYFNIPKDLKMDSISLSDEDLGIVKDENGFIVSMTEPPVSSYGKILYAFIVADSIGRDLFKMIASLTIDTKGIGTSLATGNYRRSLIDSMLIDDGTKYISGYEDLFNDGESLTEIGFIHDKMFNLLDPLNKVFGYESMKGILKQIGLIKDKELNDKDIKQITRSYVSYIMAKSFLWNNAASERKRLLFTTRKKDGTITNLSLAERLAEIKDKYPDILLFKKLETKLAEKKGEPDFIRYRTLDFEYDSDRLLNEFSTLVESEVDEIREIMQDLVKYSYVTGGNNTTNSFAKLLPPSLIINNFKETMREVNNSSIDEKRFIRQYFQHNPTEAKAVRIKQSERKNDILKYEFPESMLAPEFIYDRYYDFKEKKNRIVLYEKMYGGNDINVGTYMKIDTLGNYYTNEYEFDSYKANSLLDDNKTKTGKHVDEVANNLPNQKIRGRSDASDSIMVKITQPLPSQNTISLTKVLSRLEDVFRNHSDDSFIKESRIHQPLVSVLLDAINTKGLDVTLLMHKERSSYMRSISQIRLNDFSDFENKEEADTYILNDLLHEGVHAVSVDFMKNNPTHPSVVKLNTLMDYTKQYLANDKQLNKYLTKIEKLITERQSIDNSDKKAIDKFNKKFAKETTAMIQEDDYRYRIAYYLSKPTEFIAGVLTDKDFQTLLNKLENPLEEKSILSSILSAIRNIFVYISNIIGTDVDENSILASSIETSLEIITQQDKGTTEKVFEELTSPYPVLYKYFTPEDIREMNSLIENC